MKDKKYEVTIICITYNHEKYIEDAIKSFVMQKTNFSYKIIIHDDASTDNTRSIIEKYASKYDFIHPIYEEENQFSKGIRLISLIAPYIEGKYCAYCDGDDYWTDPYKLQKQYDFMEIHPDCSFCGHSYIRKNMKNGECSTISTENDNGVISVPTIINNKTLHISTILFRNINYNNVPDFFFSIKTVGDYPTMLYYTTKGKVYHLNDVMSVYRVYVENSWTNRISEHNVNIIPCLNEMYSFIKQFDIYTNKEHHEAIEKRLLELKQMIEYYLSILKDKYELEIKQEEIIKNNMKKINYYEEEINNNKIIINNYKNISTSNTRIIDNSIQEIYKLLECRPYKIANKIHNCFSKLNKNADILKDNVNTIEKAMNNINNNQID